MEVQVIKRYTPKSTLLQRILVENIGPEHCIMDNCIWLFRASGAGRNEWQGGWGLWDFVR